MKTGHKLGLLWWVCIALGCSWSHTALGQVRGDLLLPPAGSLPQGTGNPSAPMKNSAQTGQPPGNGIQQTGNTAPNGVVRSRVIARVNGSPILEEEVISSASLLFNEVKKNYPQQSWPMLERDIQQKSLEDLITFEAVIQDAAIKIPPPALKRIQDVANKEFDKGLKQDKELIKLKTEDEIKEYLNSQGKSIDLMRRQSIRRFIAVQWMQELCRDKTDSESTRERLLEYYREHPQEFLKKERVVWQHLYIDVDRYTNVQSAKQVAETVWQLLRNAKTDADFNAIVAKYADGISKARSGSGEGNFRGDIRPVELERFVFEQPTGGQGPVVETSRGYHVFRVLEHTPEEMSSFEKVCIELRRKLQDKILGNEMNRISKEIRDKAFVEMLNDR